MSYLATNALFVTKRATSQETVDTETLPETMKEVEDTDNAQEVILVIDTVAKEETQEVFFQLTLFQTMAEEDDILALARQEDTKDATVLTETTATAEENDQDQDQTIDNLSDEETTTDISAFD